MQSLARRAAGRALRAPAARAASRPVMQRLTPPPARTSAAALRHARAMSSSAWDSQPGPPRLPPEEQAEFERLVRAAQESAAAASLADAVAAANAAADAKAEAVAAAAAEATAAEATSPTTSPTTSEAANSTAGLNGNPIEGVWRGAPPEFAGDRNPKTGEVGGPKNEPLRWGAAGDWSYNGRVTDF